jgi:hypothetical protein
LPLAGRAVRLVVVARRFRCGADLCGREPARAPRPRRQNAVLEAMSSTTSGLLSAAARRWRRKSSSCWASWCPPNVTIAYLFNPNNPALEGKSNEMQEAARSLGRQLHPLNAGTEGEIDAAFATLVQQRVGEIGTITRQSMTLWVAARSADVDARHSLLQVVRERQLRSARRISARPFALTLLILLSDQNG